LNNSSGHGGYKVEHKPPRAYESPHLSN
jgi:hypothetical protein